MAGQNSINDWDKLGIETLPLLCLVGIQSWYLAFLPPHPVIEIKIIIFSPCLIIVFLTSFCLQNYTLSWWSSEGMANSAGKDQACREQSVFSHPGLYQYPSVLTSSIPASQAGTSLEQRQLIVPKSAVGFTIWAGIRRGPERDHFAAIFSSY